jgi:hypothetical protein
MPEGHGYPNESEQERKQRIKKLKARTSKLRLAEVIKGEDVFKKNKIKRDVAEDTAGNSYEQSLTDMLNRMNPGKERSISKGLKNIKKNKGSFEIKDN